MIITSCPPELLTPDIGDAPETLESIWVDVMVDEERDDKFATLRRIVHERDRLRWMLKLESERTSHAVPGEGLEHAKK